MSQLIGILELALIVLLTLGMAAQAADVSVSVNQGGSFKEPLDVAKPITYDVKLPGVSNAMRYDVTITIGPDLNDTTNYLTFTKTFSASPGAQNAIQFDLNFMEPQLRRREFGR